MTKSQNSTLENTILEFQLFSVDGTDASPKVKIRPVIHKINEIPNLPPVEKEGALSPSILNGSDNSLSHFIDIDAIFGAISFSDFGRAFAHNLDVCIINSEIKNKTEYVACKTKPTRITDIPHVQLGTLDLPAGHASVYYMCPGYHTDIEKGVMISYLTSVIQTASMIKKHTCKNTIKTVVNSDVLQKFAELLAQSAAGARFHRKDFIFVETFGNKHKTVIENASNTDKLVEILARSVNTLHFPHLKVDMAVSISAKDSVVFPNVQLFRLLNAEMNYFLFMNKNLANSHGKTAELSGDDLVLESAVFEKRNLYSTVEDLLSAARERSYIPEIGSAIMKSSIAGHSPISDRRSLNNQYDKLSRMVSMLLNASDRSWPYRIEVRIRPVHMHDTIKEIEAAIGKSRVLLYSCSSFFQIVSANAHELLGKIETTDVGIAQLFKSIFFEHLLIDAYLKGSANLNTLPRVLHRHARGLITCHKEFFKIDFSASDEIASTVHMDDVYRTFEKVIAYDKKMTDDQKKLLKTIVIIPTMSLSDAAEAIVKQYCADLAGRYNTPSESSCSCLQTISHPSATTESLPIKHLDLVLIYQFGPSDCSAWKRLPYRSMVALYLLENSALDSRSFLNEIKNVFGRWKLDMIFNMSRDLQKPPAVFSKLINTTGYSIRPGVFDERIKKESREKLLSELQSKVNFVKREKKNVAWSEDEIIRLLAGRRIYENLNGSLKGVWNYLCDSSLFGFLFNRTEALMRDALTRTFAKPQKRFNEHKINELCASAAIWQPENYSITDIVEDFSKFGIEVKGDAVAALKDLHAFDMREYKLNCSTFDEKSVDPERIALPVSTSQSMDFRSLKLEFNEMEERIKAYMAEQISELKAIILYQNERLAQPEDSRNGIQFDVDNFGGFNYGDPAYNKHMHLETEPFPADAFGSAHQAVEKDIQLNNNYAGFDLDDYGPIETVEHLPVVGAEEEVGNFSIDFPDYEPAVSRSIPDNEKSSDEYINFLLHKYRFRIFNSSYARRDIGNNRSRPSSENWNAFISEMVNGNVISELGNNNYRLNLKRKDGKHLSFEYVCDFLKKCASHPISLSELHHSLRSNMRPSLEHFDAYIKDMHTEGYFVTTPSVRGKFLYRYSVSEN